MSDVHNVVLQRALLSSCKQPMASFTKLVYLIFGLVLFLLSSISPSIIVFSKRTLPSHDVPKVVQLSFVNFSPISVSGLICSRTHLLIFVVVQGI